MILVERSGVAGETNKRVAFAYGRAVEFQWIYTWEWQLRITMNRFPLSYHQRQWMLLRYRCHRMEGVAPDSIFEWLGN